MTSFLVVPDLITRLEGPGGGVEGGRSQRLKCWGGW